MKTCLYLLMTLLLVTVVFAADPEPDNEHNINYGDSDFCFDDVRVEIEDGSIILTNKEDYDETVEFTEDYDLIVNGEKLDLDRHQQKLVKEFHNKTFDLIEEAKNIGFEGAKVGISGAALGLTAVGNVIKLLSPDYDSDDFERDMEEEAAKLEKKAEKLEEKAEELEDVAEDLDDIRDDLQKITPELQDFDWF